MAKLVMGLGAAHRPSLPQLIGESPGKHREEGLFRMVREQLEAAKPDVIIELSTDHFTNFYHRNMPAFCLGVFDQASGPERHQAMPNYTVPSDLGLSNALLKHSRQADFDLAFTEDVVLDHSVVVPLHFLTPSMNIPVVPLFINGVAPPLVSSKRCLALGDMLCKFIEGWDSDKRVALLASGSFALEVGGPKVGWTDEEWMGTVRQHMMDGEYGRLAQLATEDRMAAAGNASGELLNWMTVAGASEGAKPLFIETTPNGNGYGAWNLE